MPYRRRYRRGRGRYRRRRRYLSKASIASRRGSRAQAGQIMSLQRQIKSLNIKTKDNDQYVQYIQQNTNGDSPIDLTSGRITCIPLVEPSNWIKLFQSDNRTDNSNKFRGRSLGMQAQFVLGNTEEPCPPMPVFMYVVSLRKERGQDFLNELGDWTSTEKDVGKLFPETLLNKYYSRTTVEAGAISNMNSLIFLNKGVFKIHLFKRFFIGNQLNWANAAAAEDNYPSTNIHDANKMVYYKQRFSNLITPGTGQWKDMDLEDLATKDNLFCLIYYDKPTTFEADLTVSLSTLFTGKVTN